MTKRRKFSTEFKHEAVELTIGMLGLRLVLDDDDELVLLVNDRQIRSVLPIQAELAHRKRTAKRSRPDSRRRPSLEEPTRHRLRVQAPGFHSAFGCIQQQVPQNLIALPVPFPRIEKPSEDVAVLVFAQLN